VLWQLLRHFKTSGSLRCLGPVDVSSRLEKLLKERADKQLLSKMRRYKQI